MASQTIVIALAGGVGAAIGGSLAQLVQWWREHLAEKRIDTRREEDHAWDLDRESRDRESARVAAVRADNLSAYRDMLDLIGVTRSLLHRVSWRFDYPITELDAREQADTSLDILREALETFDASRGDKGIRAVVSLGMRHADDYLAYGLDLLDRLIDTVPIAGVLTFGSDPGAIWATAEVKERTDEEGRCVVHVAQYDAPIVQVLKAGRRNVDFLYELTDYLIAYLRYVTGVGQDPGPLPFTTEGGRLPATPNYPHKPADIQV